VTLLQQLNWRYATKKMDPSKKVEADVLERILEAIRLTPTSSGLQPYQVLVVTNQALKEKIRAASWDQSQVTDCSHLIVFAAWDTYTPERINASFDYTINERGVGTNERTEAYRQNLVNNYPPRGPEVNFQHTAKQTYIALGFALVAAAAEGVDATPMEGFDPNAVDEILGLRAKGLRSVTLLPIGYRDAANDWLLPLKKVRRRREDFVIEVK
jgi:nitroreductase / dihydropteridine reductase